MYAKLKAKELDVPPLYALQQPNTIFVYVQLPCQGVHQQKILCPNTLQTERNDKK